MKKAFALLSALGAYGLVFASNAFAEGAAASAANPNAGLIALGAGLAISLAAAGGAMGQGRAVSAALEAVGRNPAASAKVMLPLLLGLALIESLVILAFLIGFMLKGLI